MKASDIKKEQDYKSMIMARIESMPEDSDELRRLNEVIDALALGCVLAKPRNFGGKLRDRNFFICLARTVVAGDLYAILRAVETYETKTVIRNRMWYIMGCFVQRPYIAKKYTAGAGPAKKVI